MTPSLQVVHSEFLEFPKSQAEGGAVGYFLLPSPDLIPVIQRLKPFPARLYGDSPSKLQDHWGPQSQDTC